MRKVRPFWMDAAVRMLESLAEKQNALDGLRDDLRELEYAATSLRSTRADATPVSGGGSGREDALLNNLTRCSLLETNLRKTEADVKRVTSALAVLTERERLILDRFYVHGEVGAGDRLAGDLRLDVKTVYACKDRALYRFTLAMYGQIDL